MDPIPSTPPSGFRAFLQEKGLLGPQPGTDEWIEQQLLAPISPSEDRSIAGIGPSPGFWEALLDYEGPLSVARQRKEAEARLEEDPRDPALAERARQIREAAARDPELGYAMLGVRPADRELTVADFTDAGDMLALMDAADHFRFGEWGKGLGDAITGGLGAFLPAVSGKGAMSLATIPFIGRIDNPDEIARAMEPFSDFAIQKGMHEVMTGNASSLAFMHPDDFLDMVWALPDGPIAGKVRGILSREGGLADLPAMWISDMTPLEKGLILADRGIIPHDQVDDLSRIITNDLAASPRNRRLHPEALEAMLRPEWPQRIVGHDGRHRSAVFSEEGRDIMPVMLYRRGKDWHRSNPLSPGIMREGTLPYPTWDSYGPNPFPLTVRDAPTSADRIDEQFDVASRIYRESLGRTSPGQAERQAEEAFNFMMNPANLRLDIDELVDDVLRGYNPEAEWSKGMPVMMERLFERVEGSGLPQALHDLLFGRR